MKKSEKLLDAIGQIDDRLVEEAAGAGTVQTEAAGKTEKRKKKRKKAALYRWQGALAACAVMAVCVGVFGFLTRSGMLFGPFGASSTQAPAENQEAAMDQGAADVSMMEGAAMEAAEEAMTEGAAARDAEAEDAAAEPEALMESFTEQPEEQAKATGKQQGAEQAGRSADRDALSGAGESTAVQEQMSENVVITVTESSAQSVTFVLEYKASGTISFGGAYELEQYAEGTWQTVQPKAEISWNEELYTVGDGSSFHQTVNFGTIYGTLAPGQYRLVKYYEKEEEKEAEEQKTYPMYAEFTVSE
ncbi:MAG: hypothetical protein Q4C58_11970 [Eubacteriales bacterium]|nr:hypothetical protein [Eubacteriales bacterium]